MFRITLFLVLLFGVVFVMGQDDDLEEKLTCGSIFKLQHLATNNRLHSHNVNYASGSRQQSVTGYPSAEDPNSFWIARSGTGLPACAQGAPLKNGDVIRLQHMATNRFLHSHRHAAPISHSFQEVSAFGDDNGQLSDKGDDWQIDAYTLAAGEPLNVESKFRLKHVATDTYLSTSGQSFGSPIQGQLEVVAKSAKSRDTIWKAAEGIYFPSTEKSN